MLLRNQWPIKFRIQLCNKSKRGCRKKKAKTTKLLNVKKLKKNAIKTKTKCYTSAERKESKIYEQRNLPSHSLFLRWGKEERLIEIIIVNTRFWSFIFVVMSHHQ